MDPTQRQIAAEVARLTHDHQFRKAAQTVSDYCGLQKKISSEKASEYLPPLQIFLHWLLNNGGMPEAAQLLWTPNQFDPRPQFTRDVWNLFESTSTGLIIGAASCSKSFGMGVRLFLEWIRDPLWTTIRVIGPSEDHLETNLFSHLVNLHDSASLPMPGEIGSLFIGMSRRNQISSIKGVVIPVGRVKKAGRLQGTKRKPRAQLHPVFGELSRLFIFLDEIENVPAGVWSDIDNVLSNLDQVDTVGLKIFGAYNPTNPFDEVGVRAAPPFGWKDFDVDKHYRWTSTRGWEVLRLDGERCENVLQGKIVFPGLQSQAGLERIAKNAGGRQSPGYMSMGRGAYPTISGEMTIIPPGMVPKFRGEYIWLDKPVAVGSVDMALEGRATAIFTTGRLGKATGIKWPASLEFPEGKTDMFRDPVSNQVIPRWGLQAEQQFPLPKGDTVAMKNSVIDLAKRAGIRPEYLCLDRTGNGAGVHDLIKNEWSASVIGVNYSSSPTERKIMEEDEQNCKEAYDRIDSELWFAFRAWAEFCVLMVHPQMDMQKLTPQITQRLFRMVGGKRKVESKKDFCSRGYESPDEADSLTLLVHAARIGSSLTPSMKGTSGGDSNPGDDDWWQGNLYPGGVRVDPSNMADTLDGI
jgi:hypothetical protein